MPHRPTTAAAPASALTFSEMRARIRRPRRAVPFILDAEVAAEVAALTEVLDHALVHDRATGQTTALDVAHRLQAAEQRAEDSRAVLTLQAVPHGTYQQLRREHPPTQQQLDQAEHNRAERPAFNPDSFAPALVHAQLIDPAPADWDEFAAWWAELSDGQLARVWTTALSAQLQLTEPSTRSTVAADVIATARSSKKSATG